VEGTVSTDVTDSSLYAHGEANSFSLNLWRSCSSRTVISAMGRCLGLGDGLKPGRMGFLRLIGEVGEAGDLYMAL
jgi:hypothetical protein